MEKRIRRKKTSAKVESIKPGRSQEGNKDGRALTALFNFPKGMAYDSHGNLYMADMNNHAIRKLTPDGIVTTFAK